MTSDYMPAWQADGLCAGRPDLMADPHQAEATCHEIRPLWAYAQNTEGKPSRRKTCRTCVDRRTHTNRAKKGSPR